MGELAKSNLNKLHKFFVKFLIVVNVMFRVEKTCSARSLKKKIIGLLGI